MSRSDVPLPLSSSGRSSLTVRRLERPARPVFSAVTEALPWQTFLERLMPNSSSELKTPHHLHNLLARLKTKPSIYWYPGCGSDLAPLAFDVPNNPTGARLLRLGDECSEDRPTLLLMNDYNWRLGQTFPSDGAIWTGYDGGNTGTLEGRDQRRKGNGMWDRYHCQIVTLGPHESFFLTNPDNVDLFVSVTLFRAIVTNSSPGPHKRPHFGDEYIVMFVNAPSHTVFQEVILQYGLHVSAVALIRQGGFSSQLHYEQYTDLPKWLVDHADRIGGSPEFFFIDAYGQGQDPSKPLCPALRDYEYVGGPVKWGWGPCRAYAKPGETYLRKPKSYSNGIVAA